MDIRTTFIIIAIESVIRRLTIRRGVLIPGLKSINLGLVLVLGFRALFPPMARFATIETYVRGYVLTQKGVNRRGNVVLWRVRVLWVR